MHLAQPSCYVALATSALLTVPPARHWRAQYAPRALCALVDDDGGDAALEAFLSEPHPRITADEVSVVVSSAERCDGTLSEATLDDAQRIFEEHGVVKLCGAWDATPPYVDGLVAALHDNYDACVTLLAERVGLAAEDSFGYHQMVHRSFGRYDMLLEPDVAVKPLPRHLSDVALGGAWRTRLLGRLLGDDFRVEHTAALLARSGCAPQDPHADGGHPHEEAGAMTDDAGGAPPAPLPAHAAQLFLPLCAVSADAGPTEFWPTSHTPANAPFASLLPSIALEAVAGDAIVFDFRVVHRGTANTAGRWRPILYQTATRAWFRDDFNVRRHAQGLAPVD